MAGEYRSDRLGVRGPQVGASYDGHPGVTDIAVSDPNQSNCSATKLPRRVPCDPGRVGSTPDETGAAAHMSTLEGIATTVVVAVSFVGIAVVVLVRRAARRIDLDPRYDEPASR